MDAGVIMGILALGNNIYQQWKKADKKEVEGLRQALHVKDREDKHLADMFMLLQDLIRKATVEKNPPVNAKKILVVDDHEMNRALMLMVLARFNYDYREAISAEHALQIMEDWRPDLILLDVFMPGMGGHRLCRRLKSDPKTRDIKILILSAYEDERQKAMDAGADKYTVKPTISDDINKVIMEVLNG